MSTCVKSGDPTSHTWSTVATSDSTRGTVLATARIYIAHTRGSGSPSARTRGSDPVRVSICGSVLVPAQGGTRGSVSVRASYTWFSSK